jgi:hypothetical protein
VREIEDSMPATELAEWALFYSENPFGEFRADLRAGIVASVIAQTAGNRTAKPSDFMPKFAETSKVSARATVAARDAAAATNALMKASSRLKHHVIRTH